MKIKILIILMIMGIIVSSRYIVKANESDMNLNGYIIYVDAGHGGKDNGANNNDILEDSINLSISTLLVEELVNIGAYVYTSRDGDYDLASNYDKNRKAKDLKKRVELINSIKPDLFISIHLNTYQNIKVKGGQVFYQDNEDSKLLAEILQSKFNKLSLKDKKAKFGDYFLLNKSIPTGVLLECGFLTNSEDLKNLSNKSYQMKIVKNISKGIWEYFANK